MEEHNFRPCGFRNCYRSKHSFSLCSFSKVTTGDKNSSGVISTFRAGSPKLVGERGNMRSPVLRRRFLQSVICNPKKGRKHASSYRPESSKSLHRHTAFSNGELGYSKVSSQARSLHDQDRSQGRILFGSYSPSESEIPEIPVAKQSIPVLFSSVRSEHCTVSVYSPHETSSRFPEETGCSPNLVPGRYAHNWFDPSRSQRLYPDGCESPKSAGVHNQPGQIGSNPNSGYNISRVYNQFNNHAFHSTLRESAEITDTLPTDSFELEGSPSNPGPTSGSFGILSPSRVASTSSFSLPTSSSHQRSEPNESQLRGPSFVKLSVPRGNQLVATESRNSQWQPDYNTIFRSDNIHRRLFDGLGSCLWEHTNQREVVCHRETVAYKCSRTEGGNAGNTVAPEESNFENNIPEYGQLYSGGLYQPQGGHPLPGASPGGTTTLELVHSAQPIHNSIPCSRENQCGCRSRVERIYRQQRLESRPDNHFSLSEGLLHRPVCVTSDASTCQIHQLEARPPSIQGGRLQCELETPKGLRIPSVQPHRAGSRQDDDGQDGSCSSSTNMASATLVAPPARHAGTTTSSASVLIDSSNRPNGSPTHSPDVPSSSSGRISYLQQRYQAEGIPRNATQLLISATRNSTQKTYESSWKRWCSWCDRRETDPISASLNSILSFLADCFDEGLQYRSLNVLRSALSSTHPKIDGYPVGQHPYVLNLMKGILNNRPPKPRYSYTWDVRQVTEYIEKMGNNSSLSLKQLSLKLATLLAITCPKRVSSLARLDINHLRLSPEGATFTLTTPTKTSRPDETVTAFFSSFQTNLVLCPVDCLNSYISITKPFRNLSGKEPNILFVSHIKPHRAVTTATVARWIRSILKDAG